MRAWLWLTPPMVVLITLVSALGIFVDGVYARESASWAAQGVGQDIVNLLVACPALAVTACLAILGLSAYALAGSVVFTLGQPGLATAFKASRYDKAVAAYLMIAGAGF